MTVQPDDIRGFWFEDDPAVRRAKWFEKNPDFDRDCARFTAAIRAARMGGFDHWAATPKGGLALIVLMDQLSRNAFRDSPEAFAADPHAQRIAADLIAGGGDLSLTPVERIFVYLPFEHAETMAGQDQSVRLSEPLGGDTLDYALRHRAVIAQFGRFPHRNAILGRTNTLAEQAYLAEPGAGF